MTRGLDIDDIKFVINFDYPNNSEDYIHRIGRTGRKGNSGTSYTFFTSRNSNKAQASTMHTCTVSVQLSEVSTTVSQLIMQDLVNVLKEAKQTVSEKLLEIAESSGARGGHRGKARW